MRDQNCTVSEGAWPTGRLSIHSAEMGESDHNLQIQQQNFHQAIEEPLEEPTRRRGCRCRLDGSVIKFIGATLCIAGAIATCTWLI